MRSLLLCLVALLAAGIFVVACNTADPSECFPNTGNGFGGAGTIPIGAGVGVSSGDMGISPPRLPLGYTDANNPCVTHDSDTPQPETPTGNPGPPAVRPIVKFLPSNFPYITIVRDDGEGLGGGWQETTATLIFTNAVDVFYSCRVHIGMPIRSSIYGKLSRGVAANMTAFVANAAGNKVWPTDLPQTLFCKAFLEQIPKEFDEAFPRLGYRMMP
jgi:hypothetical protein